MSQELSRNSRRIQELLEAHGTNFEVRELPSSTRTAVEAANAVGCSVEHPSIHFQSYPARQTRSKRRSVGNFEVERVDRRTEQRIALLQRRGPLRTNHLVGESFRWSGRSRVVAT